MIPKTIVEYITITVEHHSVISTADIRQAMHGPQRHNRTVYHRQLPDTDISELIAVAEALHFKKPKENK